MMYPELKEYISSVSQSFDTIPEERKRLLDEITEYLKPIVKPKLNFICTHNSRRSHLSQIWAQTAADFYDVPSVTYSGGTEATAFHPNAISALIRAGFHIDSSGGDNPTYEISHSAENLPMKCFSKRYDESPNPTNDFVAIMTCSEADQGCPIVAGANRKIQLLYEDPKKADGTPLESKKYDERCRQIAKEMFYIFSHIS